MIEFLIDIRPVVLMIHGLAGAIGVGATVVTDALFMQFMADFKISRLETRTMRTVSRVFWIALILILITGILIYLTDVSKYNTSSKFIVKMIAVWVVLINGVVLNWFLTPRLKRIAFHTPHHRDTHIFIKRTAFACGSISLISWVLAFLLGSSRSIPISVNEAIVIYFILLGVGVMGSQIAYGVLVRHADRQMKG